MTEIKHQKHNVSLWLAELRAPFFTATIVPVLLGTVLAWTYGNAFFVHYFMLTLGGAVFLHAGANVVNDYFDYVSGNDMINKERNTPFSGGSLFLTSGRLKARSVHLYAISLFGIGILLGLLTVYLMGIERGWVIILLGIVGVSVGYFYVEPHVRIASRGLGELIVGLSFGPLMVFGSYYVQAQNLDWKPFVAGLPVGFLISAVLFINEFPDYNADKAVGKNHLVVRIGKRRAVGGYGLLLLSIYASTVVAVALKALPPLCLLALVTSPLAYKSYMVTRQKCKKSRELIPAQAMTIQLHLFTGLLVCSLVYISGILAVF